MFLILVFIIFHYALGAIFFSETDIENVKFGDYSIQSTYIPNLHLKRHNWNSSACHHLKLNISNVNYSLCIKIFKLSYPGLINESTKVYMYKRNTSINIDNLYLKGVGGHVFNFENTSFIKGYLHDNRFFGKIQIKSLTYYVEPVKHFNLFNTNSKSNDAVIYKKANSSLYDEIDGKFIFKFDVFNIDMAMDMGRPQKINGKLCYVMVAIDNSFVQAIGSGSSEHSIQKLLFNFNEVNAILRCADFDDDGIPDNIGIWISLIVTLTSKNPSLGSVSQKPVDEPVDPLDILQKFSSVTITRETCLNILLIGHPFIKQFLGVSFTPTKNIFDRFKNVGICAGNSIFVPSLNALVVTYRLSNGEMLPKPLVDVNIVHEIAHSFGSNHDSEECLKGYIMSPKTAIPTNLTNFEFSECTKRDISVMMRKQGHCLKNAEQPYCGNGIVEGGEECDCGSSYHCVGKDPCCYPRDSPNQCKVNRHNYECHPSQDLCCTSKCTYKDLTNVGLDCTKFQNKCPCSARECPCGVSGSCIQNQCHSFECTRIGLKECPCTSTKEENCGTCCMSSNGTCLSSKMLSKIVILSNPNFTVKSNVSYKNQVNEHQQTICNDRNCFHFNFHYFLQNNFCTYRGKVGICIKSRCVIPNHVAQRSPEFKEINNASKNYFVYFRLLLYLFFLINIFL